MYSAVMWTCSCLVDVMWTCDEVGWPFGLEERDVSPFVPKACCAFCRLPVRYEFLGVSVVKLTLTGRQKNVFSAYIIGSESTMFSFLVINHRRFAMFEVNC